ncbi:serine/threonine-protein kinase [Planomonospora sp. ID67723]|uniref:serine/threonine-protein kinase n=1 Tax=Planomonospora sp. ID67723 TaxID=2738134 RepID=UPI0018C3E128|nr:serine/threonine-protein kinase [Planomonospora sp. ID67723]
MTERGTSGTGRILAGRYRLLERLGEGGAGTVWRARDEMLRREVAVKELRGGRGFTERAIQEARAAARVNHPAIVMVHDVMTDGGRPWIVMDLVGGDSLDRVIDREGPLPPHQVAAIGLRLLDALEAAHAHGMLHRDVKPGNVLLDEDGTAMLADFGIAVPMTGELSLASRAGSAGYTAPERLREEPAGPPSDLWALGATLYAAVEGRAPFHRDHPAAVAAAVLMREPPAPERAGPELGGLLLALLAKDPDGRPAPAEVRRVLTGLARAGQSSGTATAPVAGGIPVTRPGVDGVPTVAVGGYVPPPRAPGRRRGLVWIAGAALLAAVAAGTVITWRTSTSATSAAGGADGGRFATAPEACDLLSVEQARELIGQVTDPRMTKADECTWNEPAGRRYRWITVQAQAVPAQAGTGATEAARLLFERRRQEAASATGKDELFGRQTWSPVRAVPGVGDEAFTQDYFRVGDNISRTVCTTWLRVGNLIVRIEWVRAEDGGVTPADQRAVQRAAEAVAVELGAATPSGGRSEPSAEPSGSPEE